MGLRGRYNAFIQDHEVAWELTMAALAALFVGVGFVSEDAARDQTTVLSLAELSLTAVFLAEFVSRLAAAYDRRRYMRGHWIDLVALIPTVRGLRFLRLVRLLRMVRVFSGMYRALSSLERLAKHRSLVWLFMAWLGVAAICSTAFYLAENGVNPGLHDPIDALWWGVVTLTTVGYGDMFPVTPEGRLAGAVLMVLGITLFAAITGTITSFLVAGRDAEEATAGAPELIRQLGDLMEAGLLSREEFEAKKAELLARI